jgi:hypothetical protein
MPMGGVSRTDERTISVSRKLLPLSVVPALVLGAILCLLVAPAHASTQAAVPSRAQWLADTRTAMSGSLDYLDQRVAEGGPGRLAVNLDIDNTALATYYATGHATPAVLAFARHAAEKGVRVLINTGRSGSQLTTGNRSLRRVGYRFAEMCGRYQGESLTSSKQRCRQRFVDEGYTIIANVGNRSTDFVGGNYERAFRLPNYSNRLG